MGDVVFTRMELGKHLLDDMKRTMEDQHQFAGFVIIQVNIFGIVKWLTRTDIIKGNTHGDTMDRRIFLIVHKGQAVEGRGGLDFLPGKCHSRQTCALQR